MKSDFGAVDRLQEIQTDSNNLFQPLIDDDSNKDVFLSKVTTVSDNLDQMDEILTNFQNLVSQGGANVNPDDIKDLIEKYSALLRKTKPQMEELDKSVKKLKSDQSKPLDYQRFNHMYNHLSNRLNNIMNRFIQLRSSVSQINHDRVKRTLEINGVTATDQEIDEMIETNDYSRIDCVAQVSQKQDTLTKLVAMEENFKQIETKFMELYDLMVEFNTTLAAQQEHIDRIEFDMNNAFDYVVEANTQIEKAIDYKKSASKKKIYIFIGVGIVLAIIIIIIIVKVAK